MRFFPRTSKPCTRDVPRLARTCWANITRTHDNNADGTSTTTTPLVSHIHSARRSRTHTHTDLTRMYTYNVVMGDAFSDCMSTAHVDDTSCSLLACNHRSCLGQEARRTSAAVGNTHTYSHTRPNARTHINRHAHIFTHKSSMRDAYKVLQYV